MKKYNKKEIQKKNYEVTMYQFVCDENALERAQFRLDDYFMRQGTNTDPYTLLILEHELNFIKKRLIKKNNRKSIYHKKLKKEK